MQIIRKMIETQVEKKIKDLARSTPTPPTPTPTPRPSEPTTTQDPMLQRFMIRV